MRSLKTIRKPLTVLIYASLLLGNLAFAYGFLPELRDRRGRGHLIFVIAKREPIRFCIKIDASAKGLFSDESIEEQTRSALAMWINPLESPYRRGVAAERIDCNSPLVNLVIDIGPDQSGSTYPAEERVINDKNNRFYSLIKIRSNWVRVTNGHVSSVRDFGSFHPDYNNQPFPMKSFIAAAEDPRYPVVQIAGWAKVSAEDIRESSLAILIHEIGHAYGLCDTYPEGSLKCDLATLVPFDLGNQPDSVMKGNRELKLSEDDMSGFYALSMKYGTTQSKRAHKACKHRQCGGRQ